MGDYPGMIDPMDGLMMPPQQSAEIIPFAPMMEPPPPPELVALRKTVMALQRVANLPNAVEEFEETRLAGLGQIVVREYDLDDDSRNDWKTTATRAMDLARQKREEKSSPWPGASNVKYPMLATAALQFAARAYPAIVDGPRIVKCAVMGRDEGGMKSAAADRVSQHMSYQLLYEVDNWESDLDTALHQLPIVGCCFKKVYAEPGKPAGFCDELVSAFDVVVNQNARSLDSVPRITHKLNLYPHEIIERQRDGRFKEFDFKGSGADHNDPDSPHEFLEQQRYWDSDEDGFPEPWIVTVHKQTQTVVKLVAGFDLNAIEIDERRMRIKRVPRINYFVKIPFIPDPQGGFYDIGFGKLLEHLSDVIDTTINQMMDAGTLQNAGGGFIAAGVDISKGKAEVRLKPGQYKTVQTAVPDLRAGIVSMEHPGPSKTLFELLSLMIDSGRDIASIQDILVGDSPANETATTTMAKIEQGLKVFTAIYKRIYRALRAEYKMIFEINKRGLDGVKYVALMDEPAEVTQADYMGDLDVMPTADPNTITDMQRMSKAQFVLEEGKAGNPHVNLFEATKRAFEAARVDNVEGVLVPPPPPDQPPPPTPEEKLAEIKAQSLRDEIEAKRQMAAIDIESKNADAQRKMIEGEQKLQMMAQTLELKQREIELQAAALDVKARDADLKASEIEMRHEVAAAGYKAKLTDMHRDHGIPDASEIQGLVHSLREARNELQNLSASVRKPKAIKFVRDQGGRSTHVETPNGRMRVIRNADGMAEALEPDEDMA